MDSGGGAVVVASGSEIVQSTIGSATTQYRKWFRLYSDGWCEQGGLCKDEITEELPVPYDDLLFQVELTTYASTPPPNTGHPWWQDFDPAYITYHSFTPHIGPDRIGGPTILAAYVARGYVSQETFKQVLAGKEWDPVTEGWGGEYLVNIESGSRELTLEPGRYKVYMVGKGGEPVSYSDGTGWLGYTGGAGGTLIAEISIADSTLVSLNVNDTSRACEFILGGSELLSAGYGKDGNNGNGYNGSVDGTGGTNTVVDDSRITIVSNVAGGNANSAFQWVSGYEGFKATATVEAVDPVRQGHGNSGNWTNTSTSVPPGSPLILLYKFGN